MAAVLAVLADEAAGAVCWVVGVGRCLCRRVATFVLHPEAVVA